MMYNVTHNLEHIDFYFKQLPWPFMDERENKPVRRDASSRMIIDEYVMRDVMPCGRRLKTLPSE